MMRFVRNCGFYLVLLCFVSGHNWLISQVSAQPATERSPLQVFLTASTKDNSPVVLNQTELGILIDNQPTEISALRSAKDDPLVFAVLVDVSKSEADIAKSIKAAVQRLFQNLATEQNQGYLVVFNGRVGISKSPVPASEVEHTLDGVTFGGGTALYDAIEQTCRQRLSRVENPGKPRRVILLISDGDDNLSHVPPKKAEEAAEEEGVAVFSLVTHSSLAGPAGKRILREISQATGGRSIDENLEQAIPTAIVAIEAQWAVTLTPVQSDDNKLHSIHLKYKQKDVEFSVPSKMMLQ